MAKKYDIVNPSDREQVLLIELNHRARRLARGERINKHSRARGEDHPCEEHQTNSADRREEHDKVAIGLRSGRSPR